MFSISKKARLGERSGHKRIVAIIMAVLVAITFVICTFSDANAATTSAFETYQNAKNQLDSLNTAADEAYDTYVTNGAASFYSWVSSNYSQYSADADAAAAVIKYAEGKGYLTESETGPASLVGLIQTLEWYEAYSDLNTMEGGAELKTGFSANAMAQAEAGYSENVSFSHNADTLNSSGLGTASITGENMGIFAMSSPADALAYVKSMMNSYPAKAATCTKSEPTFESTPTYAQWLTALNNSTGIYSNTSFGKLYESWYLAERYNYEYGTDGQTGHYLNIVNGGNVTAISVAADNGTGLGSVVQDWFSGTGVISVSDYEALVLEFCKYAVSTIENARQAAADYVSVYTKAYNNYIKETTATSPSDIKTENTDGSVKVSWNKSGDGVVYSLYRREAGTTKWRKVANTNTTYYYDTMVEDSTTYEYCVTSSTSRTTSAIGENIGTITYFDPVEINVEWKNYLHGNDGSWYGNFNYYKGTISWDEVPGAEYYIVYASQDGEIFEEVATVTDTEAVFGYTDENGVADVLDTEGQQSVISDFKIPVYTGYYFRVSAVNSTGISADNPNAVFGAALPPLASFTHSNIGNYSMVKWKRVSGASYQIYCRGSVTGTVIGTTSAATWRTSAKADSYFDYIWIIPAIDGFKATY